MVAKDFEKQKWRAENCQNFQTKSMAREGDLSPYGVRKQEIVEPTYLVRSVHLPCLNGK